MSDRHHLLCRPVYVLQQGMGIVTMADHVVSMQRGPAYCSSRNSATWYPR